MLISSFPSTGTSDLNAFVVTWLFLIHTKHRRILLASVVCIGTMEIKIAIVTEYKLWIELRGCWIATTNEEEHWPALTILMY